jgi:hypothetical protein
MTSTIKKIALLGQKTTVERLSALPMGAGRRSLPSKDEYWSGIEQFAAAGDRGNGSQIHSRSVAAARDAEERLESTQNRDGIIPEGFNSGFRSQIDLSFNSRSANHNIDLWAFGTSPGGVDPRADKSTRIEMDFNGEASRYCCGVDSTTVSVDARGHQTGRAFYGIKIALCWDDIMRSQYSGIVNIVDQYKLAAMKILSELRCELLFEGDPVANIRGLRDLPCTRINLATPFDTAGYAEVYDRMNSIFNQSLTANGERGFTRTHMLMPTTFGQIRNMEKGIAGCCDKLGDEIDRMARDSGIRVTMISDYMNNIGYKNSPAMFLWPREEEAIYRDMGFMLTMLAPYNEGGKLILEWVMSVGELVIKYPEAALMVSGVLTAPC